MRMLEWLPLIHATVSKDERTPHSTLKIIMMNPFRIVWELIEFAIQAIFVYILALIIVIGLIAYTIISVKKDEPIIIYKDRVMEPESYIDNTVVPEDIVKAERECIRPAGCRVLEDGTIEY